MGGGSSGDEESGRDAFSTAEFPTPDLSTLPEIVRLVTESASPYAHEKVRARVPCVGSSCAFLLGVHNAKSHAWGLRTLLSVCQWCSSTPMERDLTL